MNNYSTYPHAASLSIHWLAIYPVDSIIHPSNNWALVDSFIHLSNNPGQIANIIHCYITPMLPLSSRHTNECQQIWWGSGDNPVID